MIKTITPAQLLDSIKVGNSHSQLKSSCRMDKYAVSIGMKRNTMILNIQVNSVTSLELQHLEHAKRFELMISILLKKSHQRHLQKWFCLVTVPQRYSLSMTMMKSGCTHIRHMTIGMTMTY